MGHGRGRTQDDGGPGRISAGSRRRDKRGFSIPPIIGSTPLGLPGLRTESDTDRTQVAGAPLGACAVKG
jgi:hypothetical protein